MAKNVSTRTKEADAIYAAIALRISTRLGDLGWSPTDLAAAMGTTTGAAKNWVSGFCLPQVHRIEELCRVLSMTPNELFLGRK
jgi:transcriptional regulator with XRE-family HTH domain